MKGIYVKVPLFQNYPKELSFAFQDIAVKIAAICLAKSVQNNARKFQYAKITANNYDNEEFKLVFMMTVTLFFRLTQENPGRPVLDCIHEAADKALTLNCGHLVLLHNELKSTCSSVIVTSAARNQEALQSLINESNLLFQGNNEMNYPAYPQQPMYPQQPVQQSPGYPPQQFVQPPPGYPPQQQGYMQPVYPQQPQQPMYYPQAPMQSAIPPYVHQVPQHQVQQPPSAEIVDSGRFSHLPSSVPVAVPEKTNTKPVPEKQEVNQNLTYIFGDKEMDRAAHRLVLCGVPIDINNAIRSERLTDDVMDLRKASAKKQIDEGTESVLLRPNLSNLFTSAIHNAKMLMYAANGESENWMVTRGFYTEQIQCPSQVSAFEIAATIYSEKDVEAIRSRMQLLVDTFDRGSDQNKEEKCFVIMAIDRLLTKVVNRSCYVLGISTHFNTIDSFSEDWNELAKYVRSSKPNKAQALSDSVLTYCENTIASVKKSLDEEKITVNECDAIGSSVHTVTVVKMGVNELGMKIKPKEGFKFINQMTSPCLAHLCSSLSRQTTEASVIANYHWLVTADLAVYELIKVHGEDMWKIQMIE